MRCGIILAAMGLVAIPTSVSAQEAAETSREEEARQLFREGNEAFGAREYERAVQLFLRSYDAVREPMMLYNIGSAYDRAGDVNEAVTHYDAYLAAIPEASNRPHVESRLTLLRAQLSRTGAPSGPEAHSEPVATPIGDATGVGDASSEESGTPDVALGPWILVGTGAAAVATGVVFGALVLGDRSELDEACVDMRCPLSQADAIDSMETKALVADILIGVGIGAAGAGLLWLLLDSDDREAGAGPPPVTASCDSVGCAIALQGRL